MAAAGGPGARRDATVAGDDGPVQAGVGHSLGTPQRVRPRRCSRYCDAGEAGGQDRVNRAHPPKRTNPCVSAPSAIGTIAPVTPPRDHIELSASSGAAARPILAIGSVTKRWPRKPDPVLREIELELGPGELAWLTGENGAGKTTLLRIVAGIIAPDSGRVEVCRPRGLRRASRLPAVRRPAHRRKLGPLCADDRPPASRLLGSSRSP